MSPFCRSRSSDPRSGRARNGGAGRLDERGSPIPNLTQVRVRVLHAFLPVSESRRDMRRGPEHFGEQELSLVYVAQKLKHALRAEQLLTDAGLDYLVEPDEYAVGILFRRVRVGAFFYVPPDTDSAARDVLRRGGFTPSP